LLSADATGSALRARDRLRLSIKWEYFDFGVSTREFGVDVEAPGFIEVSEHIPKRANGALYRCRCLLILEHSLAMLVFWGFSCCCPFQHLPSLTVAHNEVSGKSPADHTG
jgi:hypothetical protein